MIGELEASWRPPIAALAMFIFAVSAA